MAGPDGRSRSERWVFLYGFGKNERANIDRGELKFFQEVARVLLELTDPQIVEALSAGEIIEVFHDDHGET